MERGITPQENSINCHISHCIQWKTHLTNPPTPKKSRIYINGGECVCGFVRWRRESGLCRSDALVIYIVRPPRAFLAQTHFQWGTTQPVLVHLRTKVQDLESERWWTIPRRKKMVSFCQRVGLPAAPSRWMIDGYWCTYADCRANNRLICRKI